VRSHPSTMPVAFLPPPAPLTDGVVQLRIWHPDDLDQLVACCQDPEIPRWTLMPSPYTREDGEDFLARVPESWRMGQGAVFCVAPAAEPTRVIGGFGLFAEGEGSGRIGYWIAASHRRQGVASRALRLLCAWGQASGFVRLQADVIVGNEGSPRVLEAVGFRREGVLRSSIVQRGIRHDGIMYSLLPGELRPAPD
jgi:RimJ/RimL family protein N-acetyltransferase